MSASAITVDCAFLGSLADEDIMSVIVHLDLLDNTVIMRLMNANLFLAYEVCGRLLIFSFHFSVIVQLFSVLSYCFSV